MSSFQEIINSFQHNKWVDLENHYFSYLLKISNASSNLVDDLSKLNQEFEHLKIELENYLREVVISDNPIQNPTKFDFLLEDSSFDPAANDLLVKAIKIIKIYISFFIFS